VPFHSFVFLAIKQNNFDTLEENQLWKFNYLSSLLCLSKPYPCPFTESQNVRGWKGPLWVI